jgi:hypothetical protein
MQKLYIISTKLGFTPENLSISWKDNNGYLWMCELQKWLREVHAIHIEVLWIDTLSDIYAYHISTTNNTTRPVSEFFHSYEEALEQGLQKALNLI